ncbi:MAG: DUF3576 domain-containing protein [Alphaproteobacteria bacterium]
MILQGLRTRAAIPVLLVLGLVFALAACTRNTAPPKQEGVAGADGYNYLGTPQGGSASAPAVNSFLWRASLETVAFMPLASADAYGGVLITDWYAPPETPAERFKINVFVTGRQLRADALRAVVFKQSRRPDGSWIDASVDPGTARSLEDTILGRARQMRADSPSQ